MGASFVRSGQGALEGAPNHTIVLAGEPVAHERLRASVADPAERARGGRAVGLGRMLEIPAELADEAAAEHRQATQRAAALAQVAGEVQLAGERLGIPRERAEERHATRVVDPPRTQRHLDVEIAPDEGGAGAERLASQAPTNRRERRHDRFSIAAGGGGGGGVEPLRGGSRNATRELAPEGFGP